METTQQKSGITSPRLLLRSPIVTIIVIWFLWAVIVLGFQSVIKWRLGLATPDHVLEWTGPETEPGSQDGKPYLNEPFWNSQVSWDSEYYLSIAIKGYDDPLASRVRLRDRSQVSKNYAFFPLYPVVMSIVAIPLSILRLTPIATATLAGVIIALVGTLAAMIALFDVTREHLEDSGAIRTAFYLLIFPTSFFLAQVYTEGMFVGLAFGSLALMRRNQFGLAAILAAFAVWTRAVGILLGVPLVISILQTTSWRGVLAGTTGRKPLLNLLWVIIPVAAYIAWDYSLGAQFRAVETNFFSRSILDIRGSMRGWEKAISSFGTTNTARIIYYILEFGTMALALSASLATIRRYPLLAVFSLLVLLFSALSGVPQSMARYMLVVPSIFVFLGMLARYQAFDRAWTVASILLMGMLVTLYTFDFWVA
jgi:hypothetical protein